MALRRAIGSLAVRSQASYCLRRAAASPPTFTPPPPPPPSFRRPVIVPRRSFAAPPQHVKKVVKDDDDDAGPRLNNDITAPFLRLVTDEGHDVVPRHEALQMAVRMGLDLVEVHRKSDPPVCKIMDFHKEKYNKDVKEKERLKTKSAIVLRGGDNKEVRFKAKTEIKDLKVKADAITRLMERGYRVKCMAMPAGNEAEDLGGPLTRLLGLIQDVCIVESGPHLDSKHAYVIVRHVKFATKKGGKKASKAMEDAGKGTPRTAASESPATATDSGDEVSEHVLEAEDVDKTPGYIARESSAQKEGQDRGFRGNNRGNMDNNMGNANANEGMAPEQTNRYASRRQQPGGVDSQGRPSQQDPRRSEHEGRYQRPPLEQPSPPPPRFNPGRPPQQDPRRSEHEGRYQRPPLEQPSPPPPRFNQGRPPQQDPRRNDNEDRYGFKVNQRPPLQQPGPPPPRFSQGSRPPQQDPRGNERGGHIPPYNSQRPQFQQSNPNAESAGNPASTAARSLGVFGSRKPATASEPKKTADGASSGGAGKPADAGPAKSFGIFSNPKKG